MKTIKCDRCGKNVSYIPPYMNVAEQGVVKPSLMISVINWPSPNLVEVDLCDKCKNAVYNFIFNQIAYRDGDTEK